jgi:hypothetical protein
MDKLFELIGLALPDNATMLRLKVLVAGGIGGLSAGLLFMTSGLDGAILWGTAMAACGIALIGIPVRSFLREGRKREGERIRSRQQSEAAARQEAERLARQASCEHQWVTDDAALDFDYFGDVCTRCGASRPSQP